MFCGNLVRASEAQEKLLKYVRYNDLSRIENMIAKHPELLTTEFQHPYENHNILIIACNDQNFMQSVSGKTISKLINLGAPYTEPTKNDCWQAIHYATINTNKEKLSAVIEYLTVEEANSLVYCSTHLPEKYPFGPNKNVKKSYSNNALSILLKYGRRNEQFYDCCNLLIQKGVSVNQADSNGITPLDLLRQDKEFSYIVAKLDQSKVFNNNDIFEMVQYSREKEFVSKNFTKEETDSTDNPNENLSSCTLLQVCCMKGLIRFVKHILDQGACPNKTIIKNRNSPIMIAIKEDHEEIVNLLLENSNLSLPEDILIKLQVKYKHMKNISKVDRYMELILKHLLTYRKSEVRKFFLVTDELNRTALHYAVHYRSSENILKLLSMGAPITKKDIFGYTPLHFIEPSLLEKFLDNCINLPKSNTDMENVLFTLKSTKEKFSLQISYEALIPEEEGTHVHESEFLYYLMKVKGLKCLMNHPVISSYLAFKWITFRWVVYFNLLMYLIAYISLLFYGFGYSTFVDVSNNFLLTSLILIFLLEMVQLALFRTDYIKRVENIIDLFLIAGIIYIIAAGWVKTLDNQNLQVAFSVVFLTSTLGIFMQLGNLPFFTIKVIILRQITINFFKYMVFYIFPLLAFSFCFSMLKEENEKTFVLTFYQIMTMFAGDPNSEYPDQFTTNPIFGHIIYVCFIVLIGIILQNLLIGLAVSDLQEIQKEAEFVDKKERASYITSLERVIFSKFRQSSHWFFRNLLNKIIQRGSVFREEKVFIVEPYNNGCLYVKGDSGKKIYINDRGFIDLLQNISKNLTLMKDMDAESPYSLKAVYDKLHKIETLLEKFDLNNLLKK